MRVLLQRCYEASVSVEEEVISEIAGGLCLLVGFTHKDTPETVDYMAKKSLDYEFLKMNPRR